MPGFGQPQMRRFGDHEATRNAIYDGALSAVQSIPPVENTRYSLSIRDPGWSGPGEFSLADHKNALLTGRSLARRLTGTFALTDKSTGNVVDSRRMTVASVPALTKQGTFIIDGHSSVLANQFRLLPGIYSRRKANGETESHANFTPGKGVPHRINLDPETGVFKINVGQAEIPAAALMRAMGVTKDEMEARWGKELAAVNLKAEKPHHLDKLYERMGPPGPAPENRDELSRALAQRVSSFELDPWVSKRTLGAPHSRYDKAALLTATGKLLDIAKGKAEPDDRDNPHFSMVWGPEHLISERLERSKPLLAKMLWQATNAGSLKRVQPGPLSPAVRYVFTKTGLGLLPEGSNAAEFMDHGARITKVGEGGIGKSSESVPMSARGVSPGQFPFIDPSRTSESESVGVDLRVAFGTKLGADRRIYAPVLDAKSGKLVYRSPQDMADKVVAFPNATLEPHAVIPVIKGGKLTYAPREQVDYHVPTMEQSFSPMTNMVPMKSAAKAHRSSMGSRFITQSLPLIGAEPPWVRSQVPGQPGKSFEELYGKHMGAVFADAKKPGVVESVTPDAITVRYADGTKQAHELYNNTPSGRKTSYHNEALIKPGDQVAPGQILAKSNYTDHQGTAAYGLNARVAFMAHPQVYEDSMLLSRSFADRMKSDHLYKHELAQDEHTTVGKKAHTASFPGKYPLETLKAFGDDGVVKPGTVVNKDDPLILGVRKRPGDFGRLSRSGKTGFTDASETWHYDEPGVVTDAVQGPDGPVVTVKTQKVLQSGDKVAGRFGNKGIAVVIPDHEMPHDSEGKPIDLVTSSLGTVSRANPAAILEAALGKIVRKTGKPYVYDDFQHGRSAAGFVQQELAKHGISFKEDLTDPKTGRTIPNVAVGDGYFLKLNHLAESKSKGRGLGGVDESGQPTRGQNNGAMRMSLGDTNALLSASATSVIHDAHAYRGQANPDFWLSYMSGFPTPKPTTSPAFDRFLTELRAAGVDPVRKDSRYHMMALTNQRVKELAGDREIKNGETLDFSKGGSPYPGGLFSPDIFGTTNSGCFVSSTRIWTEDGYLDIGTIVNKRLKVHVWCYDPIHGLALKPVVNWFRNHTAIGVGASYYSEKPTVGTFSGVALRYPRSLIGTHTHQVYQSDGTKIDLADANHLMGISVFPSLCQTRVITGMLLGDAGVTTKGALYNKHSVVQQEYAEWKRNLLLTLGATKLNYGVTKLNTGKTYGFCRYNVAASPALHKLRQNWYSTGIKSLPLDFESEFDETSLAIWYMDDGCTYQKARSAKLSLTIHTQCFTGYDVDRLRNVLSTRWGIDSRRKLNRRTLDGRDAGYVISITGDSARKLLDIIAPYVPDCMKYKLGSTELARVCKVCRESIRVTYELCDLCAANNLRPDGEPRPYTERRQSANIDRWITRSAAAGTKIAELQSLCVADLKLHRIGVKWEYGRKSYVDVRYVYDIEVADIHNYFANGVLVSNSSWASIPLHEPLLNPVMEEPARRLLNLTESQFRDVISGKHSIPTGTGPKAISDALGKIDVKKELQKTQELTNSTRKGVRDDANRKLVYLKGLEKTGQSPKDWILDSAPVLPPGYRPVTNGPGGVIVSDANVLYKELFEANDALKKLSKETTDTGAEKLNLYDGLKAVMGLGEPIGTKNRERGVKGILAKLLGDTSKRSYVQQKLLGSPTNLSGRAQALPNPDLDMDEVGIPESVAWNVYHPFVMRRMVRQGVPRAEAARLVADKHKMAQQALLSEMADRPILVTRYPALHRHSVTAMNPRLVSGSGIHMNNMVVKMYGGDFDGDAYTMNVPLSDDAIKEAREKLLPSKNLFSPATMKATTYLPNAEYVAHTHAASTMDEGNKPVEFKTLADARRAHALGLIGMGTRIRLTGEDKSQG